MKNKVCQTRSKDGKREKSNPTFLYTLGSRNVSIIMNYMTKFFGKSEIFNKRE